MDDAATKLVQDSFNSIAPRAVIFGAAFYDRLFERAPDLREMFAEEMAPQVLKLIQTLSTVVADLHDPEGMRETLLQLGAFHAELGTVDRHYGDVAGALLDTLAQWLGEGYTDECAAAWTAALNHVATVMLEGAAQAELPRAAAS